MVLTDKGELGFGEHEWPKTREKDRNTIDLVDMNLAAGAGFPRCPQAITECRKTLRAFL